MLLNISLNIIFTDDVNSSKVKDDMRNQLCLTDENLLKLSAIGIYLQENYGTPRDIEWAILDVSFKRRMQ